MPNSNARLWNGLAVRSAGALVCALALAACSTPPLTQADRPMLLAKCKDTTASMIKTASSDMTDAMCTCTADRLIAEKQSVMDMFSAHGREIMKLCARQAGIGGKSARATASE